MPLPDFSNRTIPELLSLKDRIAVVTGAANGIGVAIARRFVEAGARVVIADLDIVQAKEVAEDLNEKYSSKAFPIECDVRSTELVDRLITEVDNKFGQLDIWVNNAGIYPITPILDLTIEEWKGVLDVNLNGAFLGSRAAARAMIKYNASGVIINIASTAGLRVHEYGCSHYAASKNGVIALTRALSAELFGPHGIRALAIAPRTIDTPGIRQVLSGSTRSVMVSNRPKPIGRDGVPDDVARIVLFCASDLSSVMSGSTLLADGGEVYLYS